MNINNKMLKDNNSFSAPGRSLPLCGPGASLLFSGWRGVGGNQKGAKNGKGGVERKALSPRFGPFFCFWDAA
jgi:hypothetical protein